VRLRLAARADGRNEGVWRPREGRHHIAGGENPRRGLLYHIVFSTKNREPLIRESFRDELEKYMAGITRNEGGILLGVGGMPDHIHLIAKFKPDRSVAEMVRLIKANSSKWVNEKHGAPGRFAWQGGYGAFSVSQSQLDALKAYVGNQQTHHRTRSFQDEYRDFLIKHDVEFDERYLWG
jgi:putative transposase